MTYSMLGIPDLHYSPEFAQTHVHWVSDAIQPCRPVTPFSFVPPVFPSIGVFPSESALCIRWLEYWSFSFSISPSNKYYRVDFPQDWLVCSPCCPRDSQVSCPAPQFEGISSLVLSFFFFFFVQLSHLYMITGKTIASACCPRVIINFSLTYLGGKGWCQIYLMIGSEVQKAILLKLISSYSSALPQWKAGG